jgi:hypothetical protein
MMTPQRKSANRNGSVGRYDHKPQYPVRSGDFKMQLPVEKILGSELLCLTSLSTVSVILWRSVLLVEETGVPEKTIDKSLTNSIA